MIAVEIADEQSKMPIDPKRLKEAVVTVLQGESVAMAEISVAVVDDRAMTELHRRHLGQDEPTDVLSFVLEESEQGIEGEVIVSAETAMLSADWYGMAPEDELLLYVIHGTLHLAGYDDLTPQDRAVMRQREAVYLAHFGVDSHSADSHSADSHSAESGKDGDPASGDPSAQDSSAEGGS